MKSKLGDLVKIKTGKLDANAASSNGAYPFFTCSKEPLQISTFSYDCECVLVAGNGDLNVKYFSGKFDAYQRTYILETKDSDRLDVKYLFHFMSEYITTLRDLSIGGVIKYIKLNNLTDVEIPLPPLDTQRRIVEILDKADALRQKDQALLRKYDELAQAVFVDMFGDPVRNEKGWEVRMLGEVIESFKYGTNEKSGDYTEGSLPVLRIPNVIGDEIILNDLKYSLLAEKEIQQTILLEGDLLFVRTNGNPNYIGRSAVFNKNERFSYASYLIRARMKRQNLPFSTYLQFAMSYKTYRPIILKKATTTAGNYNINTEALKSLKVCCPNQNALDAFMAFKAKLTNQINILKTNPSDSLFQSLLQKAFTGELVG